MNDKKNIPITLSPQIGGSTNLLDSELENLQPEQREKLREKALDRRLELDADAKKANLKFQASSADMARDLEALKALEGSSKSDFTFTSEYGTASGITKIEIKKSNYTVIVVVSIVAGLIAIAMFGK